MNEQVSPSKKVSAKERCMTVAMQLITEQGIEKLSIREVARHAGLSSTAPYRHFASREALLAALAEESFELFGDELRNACPGGVHNMTMQLFEDMGCAYINFAQKNPERYRLMFTEFVGEPEDYPELGDAGGEAFNVLQQSIEVLQRVGVFKEGDSEQIATYVWAVIHGWTSLYLAGRLQRYIAESDDARHVEEAFLVNFRYAVKGFSAA
jgi:AcrR family transcriptional regulator